MRLILLLTFSLIAQAQSKLSFTPATQTVNPGQQATVSLTYSGSTDSAVRFYLPTSTGVVPTLTAGSALGSASKTLNKAVQSDKVAVVISGLNQNLLPQGELVKVQYSVPATIPVGRYTIAASPIDAVKPNGQTDTAFVGSASFELVVAASPPPPSCSWIRKLLGLCK